MKTNRITPRLALPIALLLLASCTDIPTISIGPTADMKIEDALNSNNFHNYRVKISHLATAERSARVTSASITPNDLLFVVYQDEFILNDYARYYFDKTSKDKYDVYFYDKEANNLSNLGYNYYQGFIKTNPNPLVLSREDMAFYFGDFPYSTLTADMFTYRDSQTQFGLYDLDMSKETLILREFFQLDPDLFQIEEFSLLIREKRIYTFTYEVITRDDGEVEGVQGDETTRLANKVNFIYDNLPLEAPSSPLINNVEVETVWKETPETPENPPTSEGDSSSSETPSSQDSSSEESPSSEEMPSSEESSSLEPSSEDSEIPTSSNEEMSSEASSEPSSSEEITSVSSENQSSETSDDDSSSEPPAILDYYRLNFGLLKDQQRFAGEKPEYPIKTISLYIGKITDFASQAPMLNNEDLTLRYFRLDEPLTTSSRYTIFFELESSLLDGHEYYFYSFIA